MSVHSRYSQRVEDQRQFFDDLITEEWDSYLNEAWDFTRRFEIERVLRGIRPSRILDIGCGCGFHDREFARVPGVSRVDGIDYSAASIDKANQVYSDPKVFRRVADLATETPQPIYDLVASFQVIEHLVDPDAYFRFAAGSCRPGGSVAIVTPNVDRLDNRIRRWRKQPDALIDPQHFHEYSRRQLVAIGSRFGLVPRHTFGHTLRSLEIPRLTPGDYRSATRWGARLPSLATVIGVVFEKPGQRSPA